MLYLDNAATTYHKPAAVYTATNMAMRRFGANPGRGGHKLSMAAGNIIYECRESLCELFHIDEPERVAMCPNTTFALNMAIKGVLADGGHAVTSGMEHNSVLRPLEELRRRGTANYTVVRGDREGRLDYAALEAAMRSDTRLVVCTHASNVCGNAYSIRTLSDIAHRHGALLCIDAAQSAGVLDIDAHDMDLLAFPGHKGLLGPQGSGGLYVAKGIELATLLEGGTGSASEQYRQPDILPDRLESGTQNVAAAAGLTAGVRFVLHESPAAIHAYELSLARRLEQGFGNIPGVTLYGCAPKVAVVAMNIDGMDCVEVAQRLDSEYDIAVRGGLHCSILAHETLGTQDIGCVRFSPGYFTRRQDIDRAVDAVYRIAKGRS